MPANWLVPARDHNGLGRSKGAAAMEVCQWGICLPVSICSSANQKLQRGHCHAIAK